MQRVTWTIPEDVLERLRAYTDKERRKSLSNAAAYLIEEALDALDSDHEDEAA